jgi:hypothetical protein
VYICTESHGYIINSIHSYKGVSHAAQYEAVVILVILWMQQGCFRTVLMRISGSKIEAVIGDCRKLHNEKLHRLYSSPNTIRIIKFRMDRACSSHERDANCKEQFSLKT